MAEPAADPTRVSSVMEDPSALAVARTYADAFLNATAGDPDESLEEFASFMDDVVAKNPEFESILNSAYLNRNDKLALIERVIAPVASEIFTNFLRVLARHDRLELLALILRESELGHEQRQGKRRVQVRSAVKLTDEALASIREQLDKALPFEPVLIPEFVPELLGGVVVQIGDTIYDSSLRNRMQQLRDRLRQRSLHEIQSGRNRFSSPEGD